MSGHRDIMDVASALLAAARVRHGGGVEGFLALSRAFASVARAGGLEEHAAVATRGQGRRRHKARKAAARRAPGRGPAENVKPQIAPVVQKKIPPTAAVSLAVAALPATGVVPSTTETMDALAQPGQRASEAEPSNVAGSRPAASRGARVIPARCAGSNPAGVRSVVSGIIPPAASVKSAPAPKPAPASPKPKLAAAVEPPLERSGITIHFDRGAEAIELAGKLAKLSGRQAQFLAVLLKATPEPVDRKFIARKLWAGEGVPPSYDVSLSELAIALRATLAPIGLTVKTVRGVGIALQPVEVPAQASEAAE